MNANLLFKIISVWNLCSELVAINVLKYEDGTSGVITSPGYPGNYPHDSNYTWIIRTGSHSANVTFRIIEMNIREWNPCDDYLEIAEIEPYFLLLKRCGQLKNNTVSGRGKKIRVSFISDKSLTDKGFNLAWGVSLPLTESLPETTTTQTLLASTTKYRERTSTKKKDVKTTSFEQYARTSFSSQVTSTVQAKTSSAPKTTESTKEYTSTSTHFFPTTSLTLIPDSPSTEENSGRTTNPETTSELPSSLYIQHSQTSRATFQNRSRPLTLARSSTVEVTTSLINTTQVEDKDTFNIQTVYLVVGSVVIEFLLLLVGCVWVNKYCKQRRSLQKNQSQQKRDNGTRKGIKSAYWKSTIHVYETIPFDSVRGLEACPEETSEEMNEQSTLYDKCWRNGCDGAPPAMGENYRDNTNTYETPERFYFTLEASQPPPLTQLATPRPTR